MAQLGWSAKADVDPGPLRDWGSAPVERVEPAIGAYVTNDIDLLQQILVEMLRAG